MSLLKRNIDLILILAIGFALRFSVSITHSYTNDELSAINRLRYNSFSDLIEFGVKEGDMHPAGVQIFEKIWSSFFGTSELALRFPFVIFGTASIFLLFLIGKTAFNRQTGLYASAIFSVLYFPIIQSELARPYSPGVLITLLVVWFFFKVLFRDEKKIRNAVFLGVCFAAGMYTHYFLFLFLIFIGLTGLFFVKKKTLKPYFISVLIAVVLYIPHISITLNHLSVGGLGWLGKPDNDFIFQFIFYAFNESWILVLTFFILIFISYFYSSKETFRTTNYLLMAIWFFGIYVLAHLLSIISTPILKFPVMIFAFPFLILMIAYLISRISYEKIIVVILLVVGSVSTYFEKELFGEKHMGYRSTAQHLVEWNKMVGDENIYTVYNLSSPDYMNFYASRYGDSIKFDWDLIEFSDAPAIREELMYRPEPFCVVGYSERLTLPQVFETVKEFYPSILEFHRYENSAVFLMSKDDSKENEPKSVLLSSMDLFELNTKGWKINSDQIEDGNDGIPKHIELGGDKIYGPEFSIQKSDIKNIDESYLMIRVNGQCPVDGQLTATVSATRNGETLQHEGENFWLGCDLEKMLLTSNHSETNHGTAYFAFQVPDFIEPTDEIKISLWNRNGKRILISEFEIWKVENIWN